MRLNAKSVKDENPDEEDGFQPSTQLDNFINSNEWYKSLIMSMEDGLIASDMNRNIVFVNPSICRKLGFRREELLGQSSLDIVVEEDRKKVLRESEIRFNDKKSSQYEITFKSKLGTRIPVLISGSPILGQDGQTIGSYAIITDIRDRKIVEKELRDKNEELQTLYNNLLGLYEQLAAIIAETTQIHTDILLFTSKHCVYCAPAEEVLQEVLSSYAGKITYRKVDVDLEPELAEKYEILSLPTIAVGDTKLTSVPDIYKLHSALFSALVPEEKFRRTRQELDNIITYSPIAILTINSTGIITSSNPLIEMMIGHSKKAVIGYNVLTSNKNNNGLFSEELIKLFKRGLKGENISINRLHLKELSRDKPAPFSIVSFKVVPLSNKEGEISEILVLCDDVTILAVQEDELSESYDKLEELNDKLIQLNKARSNYLEITSTRLFEPLRNSHELLNNILEGQLGEINDETFGTLEFLRNNLETVTKSIVDILEFSNIEAQDFTLKLKSQNVKQLISEAMNRISSIGIEKSFIATLEVPDNLIAWCDYEQIIRVLKNLLQNSIQFSNLDCRIVISAKKMRGNLVSISVQDNGLGIEKKDINRIFEEYVKLDVNSPGSGLGLTVVKSLVEAHGGEVKAISEGKNKGSIFSFTLPTTKGVFEELLLKKEQQK